MLYQVDNSVFNSTERSQITSQLSSYAGSKAKEYKNSIANASIVSPDGKHLALIAGNFVKVISKDDPEHFCTIKIDAVKVMTETFYVGNYYLVFRVAVTDDSAYDVRMYRLDNCTAYQSYSQTGI